MAIVTLELHGSLAQRLISVALFLYRYKHIQVLWTHEKDVDCDFADIYEVPEGCQFIEEKSAQTNRSSSKVMTTLEEADKVDESTDIYFIVDSPSLLESSIISTFIKSLRIVPKLSHFVRLASRYLHGRTVAFFIASENEVPREYYSKLASKEAFIDVMTKAKCKKSAYFITNSKSKYLIQNVPTLKVCLLPVYCLCKSQQSALEMQIFSRCSEFFGCSGDAFSSVIVALREHSSLLTQFFPYNSLGVTSIETQQVLFENELRIGKDVVKVSEDKVTISGDFIVNEVNILTEITQLDTMIKVSVENNKNIKVYYEDYGTGEPVILIHGWSLSSRSWENQVPVLVNAGYRVITYDRRGFGKSTQPYSGYDYDTFASDLHHIILSLDLQSVTLVGFSMGGGEVARYIGKYGSSRVKKAVFAAAVTPFFGGLGGISSETVESLELSVKSDRLSLLDSFATNFFTANGKLCVSEAQRNYAFDISKWASPKGTYDCIGAFSKTDFREDLKKFGSLPVLVLHGDSDMIVPVEFSGSLMHNYLPSSRLHVIVNGSHGINQSNSEEFNSVLLNFLSEK
jgi:pimeloyl-ACP methyl ester carboxylesterase